MRLLLIFEISSLFRNPLVSFEFFLGIYSSKFLSTFGAILSLFLNSLVSLKNSSPLILWFLSSGFCSLFSKLSSLFRNFLASFEWLAPSSEILYLVSFELFAPASEILWFLSSGFLLVLKFSIYFGAVCCLFSNSIGYVEIL